LALPLRRLADVLELLFPFPVMPSLGLLLDPVPSFLTEEDGASGTAPVRDFRRSRARARLVASTSDSDDLFFRGAAPDGWAGGLSRGGG
jgi:hypothetical protein